MLSIYTFISMCVAQYWGQLINLEWLYICYEIVIECFILPFTGRKIAIDASMSLYQFLIAVRSSGDMLVSSDGDTTRYR